jgi:hypothetical protein
VFDIFLNALAGGGAANHDHQVHGADAMQASSNLSAASQHRETRDRGRDDQASWWGGYAGQAGDLTRRHGR